jgi:hypothetical protein
MALGLAAAQGSSAVPLLLLCEQAAAGEIGSVALFCFSKFLNRFKSATSSKIYTNLN